MNAKTIDPQLRHGYELAESDDQDRFRRLREFLAEAHRLRERMEAEKERDFFEPP
jgi:hypothetical protein